MADRFEDERGVIQDVLGPVDGVTKIITLKGAVRGNHRHTHTTQWAYVTRGLLRVVHEDSGEVTDQTYSPGTMILDLPGVWHAWEALEETEVLVFTKGPRTGEGYESDVERDPGRLI